MYKLLTLYLIPNSFSSGVGLDLSAIIAADEYFYITKSVMVAFTVTSNRDSIDIVIRIK